MPVLVMCSNPACSEIFDAPDQAVGRKVRCPTCGTVQDVNPAGVLTPPGQIPPATPVPSATIVGAEPPAQIVGPAPAQTVPPAPPAPEFVLETQAQAPPAQPSSAAAVPPAPSAGTTAADARKAAAERPKDEDVIDLVPLESPLAPPASPAGLARPPISQPKGAPLDKGTPSFKATAPKRVGSAPSATGRQGADEFELAAAGEGAADQVAGGRPAGMQMPLPASGPDLKEPEISFSAVLEEAPSLLAQPAQAAARPVEISDGVLENKFAEVLIFALGLSGMAVGLVLGILLLDYQNVVSSYVGQKVLSAYVGAVLGWVGGFTLAFLIVLVSDKTETPKAHCPVCHNIFPAETELCQWCGSPLSAPTFNPLASDCLSAGAYATTNLGSAFLMCMLAAATTVILDLFWLLPEMMPQASQAMPGLIVIGAILGFSVLAYIVQFMLRAIAETVSRSRTAPDLPNFFSPRNFTDAARFVALCVLYIVPVFTIPLMPLGVLALASPGNVSCFDLRGMSRVLGRHAKDFVILWLLLLLWGAGMVLAIALLAVAYMTIGDLLPQLEGSPGQALHFVGVGLTSFVLAAIVCIFGLALCRCIGMFGRHNANLLYPARDVAETQGQERGA